MTTLLHIAAVIACIDLALLGLILATHWWRRNDPCTCGGGALNDYDGVLREVPPLQARRQVGARA
jgi:hypothetical protein